MKEMMKDVIKSTVISIGVALVIFCFGGMVSDISNGGNLNWEDYQFTKMLVGSVIIGLGYGVSSIVYRNDNIPMPIRVVIHMGIGCAIYTMVAFALGWLGQGMTIIQNVCIVVIQLAVAFLIWFGFMVYFRNEAKKMNDIIQAKKSQL